MSIEQIIVLIAFVIAMLVRAAKQTLTEAKEEVPAEARKEASAPVRRSKEVRVESDGVEVMAPARRAVARSARDVPRRGARREPPAPLAPPRVDFRPQPSDVSALRRAIVLATILGPPRALNSATALDPRER